MCWNLDRKHKRERVDVYNWSGACIEHDICLSHCERDNQQYKSCIALHASFELCGFSYPVEYRNYCYEFRDCDLYDFNLSDTENKRKASVIVHLPFNSILICNCLDAYG